MAVELATAYVSLVPSAEGFAGKVAAELGLPLEQQSREQGDKAGRGFGDAFKGAITAAASGFAGAAIFNFAKGSIAAASDLNETASKSATIFGDAATGIQEWASDAATGFGQTQQQALDAAATFGNLFVQLGVGSDTAAGMSTSLVELASDFASFHNASPQEAVEALTAAFRGEYDAVQRFVPTINAAAVEQKALAMTGKETTSALTEQEKALAAQALLMEGAGEAAGDFDRTSDSLANRQRTLAAQFGDVQARLGAQLLPAMTSLAGVLSERVLPAVEGAVRFFRELPGPVQAVAGGLAGLAVVGGGAAIVTGKVADGVKSTLDVATKAGPALRGVASSASSLASGAASGASALAAWGRSAATSAVNAARATAAFVAQKAAMVAQAVAAKATAAAQWLINAAMAANPITLVVVAIAALVAGLVLAYQRFEPFRAVVDAVAGALRDGLAWAINFVVDHWKTLLAILTGPVGVAILLVITHFDTLKAAITGAASWVGEKIGQLVGFIVELPGRIAGAVAGAATWLLQTGIDVVTGLVAGYLSVLGTVTSTLGELAGQVVEWAGDAISWLVDKGADVIGGMVNGYLGAVGSLASTLGRLAGEVIAWVGDAASWLVSKGADVIGGMVNGVIGAVGGLRTQIAGLGGHVLEAVGNAADWLYSAGSDLVAGFRNGIAAAWGSVTGFISDKLDSLPGIVKSALGISSPSKVFMALGAEVGRGMAIGVESTWPAAPVLEPAIANRGAFTTAAAAASPAEPGAGGSALHVHLEGPLMTDQIPAKVTLALRRSLVELERATR